MANQFLAWCPLISSAIVAATGLVAAFKVLPEMQNLRLRHNKELRDLMAEVGTRLRRESANAWRNPDSLEDSLSKDMSVSHIFGRTITWSEWLQIRKFITDHDIRLELLRSAWYYRDKKQAPHIGFRVTWRIRRDVWLYNCTVLTSLGLLLLGFLLVWLSINTWVLKPLISQPQVPLFLNSLGLHRSDQFFPLGASIMIMSLPIVCCIPIFNGGFSAGLICKKLKSA